MLAQQTSKQHVLNVTFPANNVGIDCEGRFMACTGGWDWAPYSDTYDQHHAHTFSRGIWKSVYLTTVPSGGAAMTHVVPHVYVQELACCVLLPLWLTPRSPCPAGWQLLQRLLPHLAPVACQPWRL